MFLFFVLSKNDETMKLMGHVLVHVHVIPCIKWARLLPFSNKSYQQEIVEFTDNKYSPGLLISCPGMLHVTV